MFKVSNKDTTTTPMASFWYLYCWLWTYFIPFSSVSIVNFEQVNAGWESVQVTVCGKALTGKNTENDNSLQTRNTKYSEDSSDLQ